MKSILTNEDADRIFGIVKKNLDAGIPRRDDYAQGITNVGSGHYNGVASHMLYYAMAVYWQATAIGKSSRWHECFAQLVLGMEIPYAIDPEAAEAHLEYALLKVTLKAKGFKLDFQD